MLRRYSGSFSVSLKRSETCFLVLYMGSWSSGCGSLPFLSAITSHPGYGHVSLIQAHTPLTLPGERNPHCNCLVQIVTVLIHLALLAGVFQPPFLLFLPGHLLLPVFNNSNPICLPSPGIPKSFLFIYSLSYL